MRHRSEALILILGLAGCSGEASHLPPLWQVPGAAISSVIENAAYDARRAQTARFVAQNEQALIVEIDSGGGPLLMQVMAIAGVPPPQLPVLVAELRDNPGIYRLSDNRDRLNVEATTVAVMVHRAERRKGS